MIRPYDYLPMITPDMVASVQQVSEEVQVEYLVQRQMSLCDDVVKRPATQFAERASLLWASAGLVYATLDAAFTQDYGALYALDHLPRMNHLNIQADLGKAARMPPMQIFENFGDQQTGQAEDKPLDKALRTLWEASAGWQGSEEDKLYLLRTRVVAGVMMFIVNNESDRTDRLHGRIDFPR